MSYAIFGVMYGIPLTSEDNQDITDIRELMNELEPPGFESYYSGNADVEPCAFGVNLCDFDECVDHIKVSDLKLVPTQEQIDEYNGYVENLKQYLEDSDPDIASIYGRVKAIEPFVFFIPSSS